MAGTPTGFFWFPFSYCRLRVALRTQSGSVWGPPSPAPPVVPVPGSRGLTSAGVLLAGSRNTATVTLYFTARIGTYFCGFCPCDFRCFFMADLGR